MTKGIEKTFGKPNNDRRCATNADMNDFNNAAAKELKKLPKERREFAQKATVEKFKRKIKDNDIKTPVINHQED